MERALAVLVGGVGIVLLTLSAVAWSGQGRGGGGGVEVLAFRADARTLEADEPARLLGALRSSTTEAAPVPPRLAGGADVPTSSSVPPGPASPPDAPGPTLPPTLAATMAEVSSGAVRFEVARADLDGRAHEVLERLGRELAAHPDVVVVVRGHTDSTGPDELNLELSARRAQVVAERLVAAGARPDQTLTTGLGPTQPVADNATDDGRRANRRSEVVDGRPS